MKNDSNPILAFSSVTRFSEFKILHEKQETQ